MWASVTAVGLKPVFALVITGCIIVTMTLFLQTYDTNESLVLIESNLLTSLSSSPFNCSMKEEMETYPLGKIPPWPSNSVTNKSLYSTNKVISGPAVILRVKGGIGNQLFQYACHYALARKNSWPLYIFQGPSAKKTDRTWSTTGREYALDKFNIPLGNWNRIDQSWDVTNIYWINDATMMAGGYPQDKVLQQSGGDYCQSEFFFSAYKSELLKIFWPIGVNPSRDWISKIQGAHNHSVAVHIRRGDYIRLNSSVPLQFFRDSMKDMVKRLGNVSTTFFIFSDDIKYVNEHLFKTNDPFLKDNIVHSVSDPKTTTSLMELQLMSMCKHQIVSFSTFSWWGAYLNRNPDKIIMAAHENPTLIESIYKQNKNQQAFFIFLYRNIYYPSNWISLDPNWDATEDL